MIGNTGIIRSGIVACNSNGTEFALVISTTTNWDIPAMKRTVSLTSRLFGPGKSKITGTFPCRVKLLPTGSKQSSPGQKTPQDKDNPFGTCRNEIRHRSVFLNNSMKLGESDIVHLRKCDPFSGGCIPCYMNVYTQRMLIGFAIGLNVTNEGSM